MVIKTITCHDVYNVGAGLQAYALSNYLKELGHEVEIIDYKPDYLNSHYPLWGVNNSAYDRPFIRELYSLAKLPGRLKARFGKRKKAFDRFTCEFLATTKRRYTSNEELKKYPPEADVIFAGSDQIWNALFQNGKDPAFYLDFADKHAVRASYAASFATDDVAEELKPQLTQWLSEFDGISVRESSGVEIIEQLGISGAVQVLDPVFLLSAEKWAEIAEPVPTPKPYVLLYDFDNNKELQRNVRTLADEKGLQVYSVLPCSSADRCFDQFGPGAFLTLVKNAELVISNSFHATAFSLIFEKNFYAVNRVEKINTRMRDLTELVGLSERLISGTDKMESAAPDYGEVRKVLDVEIARSGDYIDKVLRKAGNR